MVKCCAFKLPQFLELEFTWKYVHFSWSLSPNPPPSKDWKHTHRGRYCWVSVWVWQGHGPPIEEPNETPPPSSHPPQTRTRTRTQKSIFFVKQSHERKKETELQVKAQRLEVALWNATWINGRCLLLSPHLTSPPIKLIWFDLAMENCDQLLFQSDSKSTLDLWTDWSICTTCLFCVMGQNLNGVFDHVIQFLRSKFYRSFFVVINFSSVGLMIKYLRGVWKINRLFNKHLLRHKLITVEYM